MLNAAPSLALTPPTLVRTTSIAARNPPFDGMFTTFNYATHTTLEILGQTLRLTSFGGKFNGVIWTSSHIFGEIVTSFFATGLPHC